MLPLLLSLVICLGCEFQEVRPLPDNTDNIEGRAGNIEPAADYEAALTTLLQDVVTEEGLVRYDRLNDDLRDDFRRVLKAVEEFDLTTLLTQEARFAFWMNAYNVQMLQHIIETPEVRDIIADGFGPQFFETRYRTAQRAISLNEIEHVILRSAEFDERLAVLRLADLDPRLHVGLNCAALSCPRLRSRAFTAANVSEELDIAMREYVNSPNHFSVRDGNYVLSSLLDWFGSDFDSQGQPAGDYLLSFMSSNRPDYAALRSLFEGRTAAQIKAQPNVTYQYIWQVNRF